MKKITKILLVGATIASTTTAGITHSNSLKFENEKNKIFKKLKETSLNYDKLQLENKKLSKRIITEINRIIILTDSVKHLDKTLKEDKLKLSKTILLSKNLSLQNNNLTSRNRNLNSKIIKAKKKILTTKASVMDIKESITAPIFVSNLETTLVKKKTRGGFTKTTDYTKIDGFKSKFSLTNNDLTNNSEKKKISLILSNLNNRTISYSNEVEVKFEKKFLDISTIIEVDREKVIPGDYEIAILIDNKKIESSNIKIDIN